MIDSIQIELKKLLIERSFFNNVDDAVFQIRRGRVFVDNVPEYNPNVEIGCGAQIRVVTSALRFVSRGGTKLEHAINELRIEVEGRMCIDIGASTGGFTDCLLAYGAARVYAVDVGYGILDWGLRNHPKVVVLERTNARLLTNKDIPDKAEIITIDVNHISAVTIVKNVVSLLGDDGTIVLLVKPQFEIPKRMCVEPDYVKGVVKCDKLRHEIVQSMMDSIEQLGLLCSEPLESPIKGAAGNREYFVIVNKSKL